jgi:GNAT superfamily N-acetyltransferase
LSKPSTISIRQARLPDDSAAILSFIDGIQTFENPIEPDRRTDAQVAEEYLAEIAERLANQPGAIFLAEDAGTALGWALVGREQNAVYVREDERAYANISELYVDERARGKGIGQALIAACEEWARSQRLGVVMIGVLPGNQRANAIYREAGFAPYALQLRKYVTP